MSEKQGYTYHWGKNLEEWTNKFYNKYNPREDCEVLPDLYCIDDLMSIDEEFRWSVESLQEAEQVKILYNYDIGQHVLKIKWEHNAWWKGDVLHHYYCVMLPIDQINLVTPYELARSEEE